MIKISIAPLGVVNERNYYKDASALSVYCDFKKGKLDGFPHHEWTKLGIDNTQFKNEILVSKNIGFLGYASHNDKIIVDELSLSDPLLSKIPADGVGRIGHYSRQIPKGYIESILTGSNKIHDAKLAELYDKIKLITQSCKECNPGNKR